MEWKVLCDLCVNLCVLCVLKSNAEAVGLRLCRTGVHGLNGGHLPAGFTGIGSEFKCCKLRG
jgi:hypothetical protein